jgi:predicted amidohydrolase
MTLRVAAIQRDIAWEDREANLADLGPLVKEAAAGGARLVLLAELFAVGFSTDTPRIAEPVDGPTTAWLLEQAATHGAWVGGSVPVRFGDDHRPANTFVLAGPTGEVHRYRKVHPFSYAGEHEHYRAGFGVLTVEIDGVRVSPAVCYDLRFADQFWGQALGTDLYVVVANWPAARRHHWRTLLTARAIENQAYVIGVNRIGEAPGGLGHAGDSLAIDPLGATLADAGADAGILVADIDPAAVAAVRAEFPFLQDR